MHRRTTLAALASLTGVGLSGCLGGTTGAGSTPTPVDLGGTKADDQGGMVIGRHGGPNGQLFYANERPEGHDNPAWFHTLTHGLFPYYFRRRREGWEAVAIYVTDYSLFDYELLREEGRTSMPAPTAPDTFGDGRAVTYVMESDVRGGMGPALIPFSDDGDARAFVDDHGGRTVTFGEITPELIAGYARR
ncbi:nitrous oxide reductase accessory protein NosL [Haloplanus halophilus]|uniref:nitrous oxide reductase accessory protein NosL n=1 Tax=Haloplanus halophilus TaxID=2949993 RepID=UPI0020422281|nr:nitrous oxide reductase accessory protein NosL [Haloplanus sp. GDY1]